MTSANKFPIDDALPRIRASLAAHTRLVIEAPPGAGKTTQLAPGLLGAQWCAGRIVMLEPRRIAARAAATFMAAQLGESVGQTVGYRIRFENRVSAATRIEIVTEGILTRMLQDDPGLRGISAVIFDEFHERHLASDLGLAMCLDVQTGLRADLRIIVMSATLDGERLEKFLAAPRVSVSGRSYPVSCEYVPRSARETAELQLRRAVARAEAESDGDILCFFAGKDEIRRAQRTLSASGMAIELLHGDLSVAEQARVLGSNDQRRLVLATNVAESSVTLPGVRAVIDTGMAREPRFDPVSGMSSLELVRISQASATQRAGRAGRLAPGKCYRLWPQSQHLEQAARPEIQQVELSHLLLEIKAWGAAALRFLDPPPVGALAQAQATLESIGALDVSGRLTPHGRALLPLGLHPRLASAMLRSRAIFRGLACDVAAVLSERELFVGEARRSDDLAERVRLLRRARAGQSDSAAVNRGALRHAEQTSRAWRRRLGLADDGEVGVESTDVGLIVALAYPENIARRDPNHLHRYQMASGRGARLEPDSEHLGAAWLAVARLRDSRPDGVIQLAVALAPSALDDTYAGRFHETDARIFARDEGAVVQQLEQRFDGIVLERRVLPAPRDDISAAMLLDGLREIGLDMLPWTPDLRQWQARVQCLRRCCPELKLADISDAALLANFDAWLAPAVVGKIKIAEIDAQALQRALHGLLDYAQGRAIDELAPQLITVPSGRQIRLHYSADEAPVLAVKLQELFGLAVTPTIARARIPVTLHLLSPRGIPIQVTQDLAGFWQRTYPQVKKELKGRYPRHPWPDDPLAAVPTHRTTKRSR